MNFVHIPGTFAGGIPSRKHRVPCVQSDWVLSLGMHNFRRALRIEGSKSQSLVKRSVNDDVGKPALSGAVESRSRSSYSKCKRRRRRLSKKDKGRRYRIAGKWKKREIEITSNVNKSIIPSSGFDEKLLKALRAVEVRKDGQYWRKVRSLPNLMAKTSKKVYTCVLRSSRWLRRSSWLFSNSWSKLPVSFLKHTKLSFFDYCRLCKIFGHHSIFHQISHGYHSECVRIKQYLASLQPIKYELFSLMDRFKLEGFIPPVPPHRDNYHNYKSWMEAKNCYSNLLTMIINGRLKCNDGLDYRNVADLYKTRIA